MPSFQVVIRNALDEHVRALRSNASVGDGASALIVVIDGVESLIAVFDEYGTATTAPAMPDLAPMLELFNGLACDIAAGSTDAEDLERWASPAFLKDASRALRAYGQDLRTDWSLFDGRAARGALDRLADVLEHPEDPVKVAALADEWADDLESTEQNCGITPTGKGRR